MAYFSSEELDNLCKAIAHRRSMGLARYLPDKPVDPCLIERMLQAADWAPSHGDTEPWRFTVFLGESRRALGAVFGEIYRLETRSEAFRQDAYEAHCHRVWAAPVWISIGMTPTLKPDGTLLMSEAEELMAVACAVQNLHIVASAQGLAGMWHSKGPYIHPHTARFLGLEPPSRLLGFFHCGWSAIPWPEGERRPLSEKVRWAEPSLTAAGFAAERPAQKA
jgi:nitroreductase